MSTRNTLRDAARDLLIAVTDAVDSKVINAGAKGPRPAKPYVTVRLTTIGGGTHGPAERVDGLNAGAPTARMQERREAVVSYQGYGPGALVWLDQLQGRLDSPASLAEQSDSGIAALLQSAVRDLSTMLDTQEEDRSSMELRLRYQHHTDSVDQVALQRTQVSLDLERYAGDGDTLSAAFDLDADGDLTTPE